MSERQPITSRLRNYAPRKPVYAEPQAEGRITRAVGLTLEAVGLNVSVGRQCEIINNDNRRI